MSSPLSIENQRCVDDSTSRLHFVGIAGAGMSALAEYRILGGGRASGSDRFFDQGKMLDDQARCNDAGIRIYPQGGEGIRDADLVIASGAVEAAVPDLAQAREQGRPILHRSELLAHYVASRPTVAVTGTSGKSTVAGLTWSALQAAGAEPGLITGGELLGLRQGPRRGNAAYGSGPLVVEADESDGSCRRYTPRVGVILNLHRDHLPAAELLEIYGEFAHKSEALVVGEDDNLAAFHEGACVFGFGPRADVRAEIVSEDERGRLRLRLFGSEWLCPLPGRYNALNFVAAYAVAQTLGVDLEGAGQGLADFAGIHRRYEMLGEAQGVMVIDDFAHNPAKIHAVIKAARREQGRLIAVFQPHGFGPLKFQRAELLPAFRDALGAEDRVLFLPVFFAGGTATQDISSADVVGDLQGAGLSATASESKDALIEEVTAIARPNDTILIMGARDPDLPALARRIYKRLASSQDDAFEAS